MNIEDDDNCNDCHELQRRIRVLRRRRVTAYFVAVVTVFMCLTYVLGRDRLNDDILKVPNSCEVIENVPEQIRI